MLIKTRGIVLRQVKYSETSLILDIFTEEKGKASFIVSGVRKAKSSISAGLLQVTSLLEIVAYYKESKSLHRIKEVKSAKLYSSIPFDPLKRSIAVFMAELAQKSIRETESSPSLFHYLFNAFAELDEFQGSLKYQPILYAVNLSFEMGFGPQGRMEKISDIFDLREGLFRPFSTHPDYLEGVHCRILSQLLDHAKDDANQVKSTRDERQDVLNAVVRYFRLHVEGMPKINAHTILRELF